MMFCPICGGKQGLAALVDDRQLVMCNDCRHVTWQTMPTQVELNGFYASGYTESHGQDGHQTSRSAYYRDHVKELALLVGRPVADMAIADIGCSIPIFLEEAAALGCRRVIGVDWSAEARSYGAERGVEVVTPDAFADKVEDHSLDLLRYSHVLEHLPDPMSVLADQVKKLKPGGLLHITQPNLPMLRNGGVPAPFDNAFPTHLQFFTPASLIRLVEAVGCRVERFFTVTDPNDHVFRHGAWFDMAAALDGAGVTATRGEPQRGLLNNFPFHFGRNSVIYARSGQDSPAPSAPCQGDALLHLLAARSGNEALAYAVGTTGDEAEQLLRSGFARVVTFGADTPPAVAGAEHVGQLVGAEPGVVILGYSRLPNLGGKLRLMERRILGKPGSLREVEVITLDERAERHDETPGLIQVSSGNVRAVLAGACGIIERTRPALLFPMADSDIPLVQFLTGDRYDLLRTNDWSWALDRRPEHLQDRELVVALPRTGRPFYQPPPPHL